MNKTFSNLTNITTVAPIDYIIKSLNTIDHLSRYYCLFIHVFFFIVFSFSKYFHKRSMLYVNHATIVNCFYCISQIFYIFGDHPALSNENLNEIICSFSEIFWIFCIYIRMYSILLIAMYRYLPVFKLTFYKRLNESLALLIVPIVIVWIISIATPLISKYIFNTTHGYTLCLDGYSTSITNTIAYCIYNYLLMIIIPSFFVFIIYIGIIRKLKQLNTKIGNENALETRKQTSAKYDNEHLTNNIAKSTQLDNSYKLDSINGSSTNNPKTTDRSVKKQELFANQFILMCLILIACGIVHAIFSSRALIPNYFNVLYYWRPVLKTYLMLAISFVPFISLYYHPDRSKLLAKIKNLF